MNSSEPPCFVRLGLLGRFWRWLGFYRQCERLPDGYCARCHQEMYP